MRALIDACVLANFSLCDTLLRCAEPPSLFEPRWSEQILVETVRTLESKLHWPQSLTASLQKELRTHFRDEWIEAFEYLMPAMRNDPKDRHVLAAAVHGQAATIVTFNLRDFCAEHLEPWGVVAVHPQDFLTGLFRTNPRAVMLRISQQASERNRSLDQLLQILHASVPRFAEEVARIAQGSGVSQFPVGEAPRA